MKQSDDKKKQRVSTECTLNSQNKIHMIKKDRYSGIDGLRTYAILGIVIMHVLANGRYEIDGFIGHKVIPSFYNLVFLFMMVSAFGMCCGYYERIRNDGISIDRFYSARFAKIWPYFALLSVIDVVVSPSKSSVYEMFANLTLCFGLLPNAQMSVIGVGWTLGVIFVFYLLFPFYCFLLGTKKRAYITFLLAFIFNYLCIVYFNAERSNIVYSFVYFVIGGVIYLNRVILKTIVVSRKWLTLLFMLMAVALYYFIGENTLTLSLICGGFLIVSLGSEKKGFLTNKFTKFISGISFEIYLCHMIIFRILDKLNLTHIFDNEVMSYVTMCSGTIVGAVLFAIVTQYGLKYIKTNILKYGDE